MNVAELREMLKCFKDSDTVVLRLTGFLGDDEIGRLKKVESPLLVDGEDDFIFETIHKEIGKDVVVLTGRP